jgi:hypothetical protein
VDLLINFNQVEISRDAADFAQLNSESVSVSASQNFLLVVTH